MPTSSFFKKFELKTKREIEAFIKIISEKPEPFNISPEIRRKTAPEAQREAEEFLMRILKKLEEDECCDDGNNKIK